MLLEKEQLQELAPDAVRSGPGDHRPELQVLRDSSPTLASVDDQDGSEGPCSWDAESLNEDVLLNAWRPDAVHFVSAEEQVSYFRARRLIGAALALEDLPCLSDALEGGELSLDKVLDLARFATPEEERRLIRWARKVSIGAVRARADEACRRDVEEAKSEERRRSVSYGYNDDGSRFWLNAFLPAPDGAIVAKALDREANRAPLSPEDDPAYRRQTAWADALVALCMNRVAEDADADRATVVAYVDVAAKQADTGGCSMDGVGIAAATAARLLCDCRLQTMLRSPDGYVLGVGRASYGVPRWLRRALEHRDHGCVFPGCGTRRFVDAHHVVPFDLGGPTDLDNLCLLCRSHHKLVHEFGWKVMLGDEAGTTVWFEPNGKRYEPGRSPPHADRNEDHNSLPRWDDPGYLSSRHPRARDRLDL